MAGIAVISKMDAGSVMIRLILNREIVDRIEVEDAIFLDGEMTKEELMALVYREAKT